MLKRDVAIIYIPGLGDRNLRGRQSLLNLWHFRKLSIEICSMQWSVDEPWSQKLDRLLATVETHKQAGKSVTIVGESAGASAVINALDRSASIDGAVLLCGKSQFAQKVSPHLYVRNPALKDALIQADKIIPTLSGIQKTKILNLHPLYDPVVPVSETKISGVKNATMPVIGHATSIVFANLVWSWRIVRFARQQARRKA